ncbi:ribonuclease domain-containing protein [Granulicoccus phenolivorans]|uniref:ribonuclease domain-containing protein n=1 Tax=Granulicoccus phenolivorans TaxID=266854 RepID=UPI0003F5BF92|nr:ribonuclease domain-containing protein [Granulicoccus phenolivorans]
MKLSRRTLSWAAAVVVAIAVVVALLLQPGSGTSGRAGSANPATHADSAATKTAGAAPSAAASRSSGTDQQKSKQGSAQQATDPETGLRWIDASALPAQARDTLTLIDRGGPYPYDKDGATFGNFERVLPDQPRGYYREYTVVTPGENDRGARRIVTGNNNKVYFWTDDHYATFARIRR